VAVLKSKYFVLFSFSFSRKCFDELDSVPKGMKNVFHPQQKADHYETAGN